MRTFKQVKEWLESQSGYVDGMPTSVCETGQPYQEFSLFGYARPGDEPIIEAQLAERLFSDLCSHIGSGPSLKKYIYVRIPLEWNISQWPLVIRYDPEGPDFDRANEKKCYMDHEWISIRCYVRLVASDKWPYQKSLAAE